MLNFRKGFASASPQEERRGETNQGPLTMPTQRIVHDDKTFGAPLEERVDNEELGARFREGGQSLAGGRLPR